MKITLNVEIEFESLFDENRQPKTNDEWNEFLLLYFFPENPIVGKIDEHEDLIHIDCITSMVIKFEEK